MKLLRSGNPVATVFDLLGRWEDDMTYALGFVTSRSPAFAQMLARKVGGEPGKTEGIVKLQDVGDDGRTDVELRWPNAFHGVFEAKRGPRLPTMDQLRQYVPRLERSKAKTKVLVAVTNSPSEYASRVLLEQLDGVPVRHLTWRSIRALAQQARSKENNRNKHMLQEFGRYLTEILGMETIRSNMVYVVSLGSAGAWGIDFKEVVTKRRCYFYPAQGRWPSSPPNYIAFRYDGRLQAIHHVDAHDVFDNPHNVFNDAKDQKCEPHYLLRLGPLIQPPHEVKTGDKIKQSMRVWAMLDLLLTCSTITEARDKTKERLGREAKELETEEGE